MKFTNKSFVYYLSNILMVIGLYFFVTRDDWNRAEFIYIPLLVLSFFLTLFNYYKSSKKRAANLSEYAKQNELIFAEEPEQEQIDEFRTFKAVKGIAGYRNSDFSNILVTQEYRTSKKGIKPKIITGRLEIGGGQHSSEYFTQIFLYEIDHVLPIFYLLSKNKYESLMPFSNKISSMKKNNLGMKNYQKLEINNYDFPSKRYDLYSPDLNAKNVFNREFIDLLKTGIKKNVGIHIESNGNKLIFFIKNQRHSPEGLDFYTNLFEVMITKLKNRF